MVEFRVDRDHRVRRGSHRDTGSQLRSGDVVRETFNTDDWPCFDLNPCLVHCASRRLRDFFAGLCGDVRLSSRTRGDSGDVCYRWLRAAIDVAVNDLVVVPDIATRGFDRKIYGPKCFGQSSVLGLNLSVVQFFGRNVCPDLRLSSSRTGSFQ